MTFNTTLDIDNEEATCKNDVLAWWNDLSFSQRKDLAETYEEETRGMHTLQTIMFIYEQEGK